MDDSRITLNYAPMIQRLKQALSQRQQRRIIDARRVPSAVLLPIFYKNGEYYILFTKRTERVKDHKAQISFPGGVCEKGDRETVDTALRECNEEIGLTAEVVELLGELDDTVTTTSNYIISPFVAVIPWPLALKVNQWETEEIIEVPISALMDKNSLRRESTTVNGKAVTSYFYHYQGRVIWGATAEILNQFLDIFTRVLENEQGQDTG